MTGIYEVPHTHKYNLCISGVCGWAEGGGGA